MKMVEEAETFNEFLKPGESPDKVGNKFTISWDEKSVVSDEEHDGNILSLPGEMLSAIFIFLPLRSLRNCTLVCKKFREFSFDFTLWRRISLSAMKVNIVSLERILNCGVRRFSLDYSEIAGQLTLIPPFFESKRFKSLQHLDIYGTKMKSDLLESLLKLTPQLKSIKLRDSCEIIGNGILRMLLSLEYLESLDVNGDLKIDHTILDVFKIARIYANLRNFCFERRIPADVLDISKKVLENLFKLSPNIVSLDVEKHIKFEGEILKYILNMMHIKKLSMAMNQSVLDNTNRKISSNHNILHNLSDLDVSAINFKLVPQFFKLAPNLKCVYLRECFIPETVWIQMMNLQNFRHLTCWKCGFESFPETLGNFESLQSPLRELSLLNCYGSIPELLCTWLSRCSYLLSFDISFEDADWIPFESLLALKCLELLEMSCVKLQLPTAGGNFAQLKTLYLGRIDISEVELVLSFCLNITSLYLFECVITQYVIQCVMKMKNLKNLTLIDVKQDAFNTMSDSCYEILYELRYFCFDYETFQTEPRVLDFLFSVINRAINLKKICLKNLIVTKAIYRCILNMKELCDLEFAHVFGVSSENIPELLKNCPKLRKKRIQIK